MDTSTHTENVAEVTATETRSFPNSVQPEFLETDANLHDANSSTNVVPDGTPSFVALLLGEPDDPAPLPEIQNEIRIDTLNDGRAMHGKILVMKCLYSNISLGKSFESSLPMYLPTCWEHHVETFSLLGWRYVLKGQMYGSCVR